VTADHAARPQGDVLLDSAIRHLADVGLEIVEVAVNRDTSTQSDALLRITSPAGSELYEVRLRSKISPGTPQALHSLPNRRALLVTSYVSDTVAELLRQQDIHYVDSAGNMYLRWAGLLLDVRGRRRSAIPQPAEPGRPLRAFKSSGLKVLFALLSEPNIVAAPYRDIAQFSGTSLGTVQWVLKELEGGGYVSSDLHDRQLHRVRDLFSRWVEAYAFDLWPRLTLAHFQAPNPTWWREADDALRATGAQWGGETAAHHLNPHLRPGKAVIYASTVPKRLAIDYRFQKADDQGNVEIRKRFWHPHLEPSTLTVPAPLVYADLIASADPRQLEAATELREHDAFLRRPAAHLNGFSNGLV